MISLRPAILALAALLATGMPLSAATANNAAKPGESLKTAGNAAGTVSSAAVALREITSLPKRKIPPVLLKEATAIIIVPRAAKKAFMVSGGLSTGVLMERDKTGAWGSPVFITLSGGTLGWQIVGDPMDIVLLFRNNKSLDALLKGKVTLDAKVSIVPGRVAATMTGASKEELAAEISSYVRSHGAFAEEVVVAGVTLQVDAAANESYYATPKVTAGDILSGKVGKTSGEISSIHKQISDYAAAK